MLKKKLVHADATNPSAFASGLSFKENKGGRTISGLNQLGFQSIFQKFKIKKNIKISNKYTLSAVYGV
ncbi:hypothetical protein ACRAD_29020 (plasmid) [Acinetobacter radioresistens DSM 6976 = NBRC 102413 = CIP 103788]|nr:hypothetical protein ACRAD_29020 [Acinetobacter radioresistens DSM 6976 = NBRC 102413 = CIP 103788]